MPISRIKRSFAGAVFLAVLAACDTGQTPLTFLDNSEPQDRGATAVREAILAETVKIKAPTGYCIDPTSRRSGLNGHFAVIASCAALDVRGVAWPRTVAVMTVSATRAALPAASVPELERFVTSPEGRSLLSSGGDGAVEILQTESASGAFFVRVAEQNAPVTDLEQTYWRGLVAAGGRLVSLTVRGYDAEPLDAGSGLQLIRTLATDIRTDSASPSNGTATEGQRNLASPLAALFPKQK